MADSVHSQDAENVVDPDIPSGNNNNNAQETKIESKEAEPAQSPVSGSGEPLAPVDAAVEGNSCSCENVKPLDVSKSSKEGGIKVEPKANTAPEEKKVAAPVENDTPVNSKVEQNEVKPEQSNTISEPSGEWQQRETELLKKIEELELVKSARSEDGLRLELKVRDEEIDLLKARVKNLETELHAALSKPSGKNKEMIEKIKQQHEELLSKARGMIFDKTKMVKNQELQIEALTTQVQSLKDINVITKDLLEIRNSEVKAMEERFQAMDARFKAEKERYALVLQRAQAGTAVNDDLRREYETQLAIFKELREKYEQRVQALVAENKRLKESKGGTSG